MSSPNTIYLDYAAATPMSQDVVDAMMPYFSGRFYNPSAIYLDAKAVRSDVEDARHRVAQVLGARPDEIIFTAGATESCNFAIKGVLDIYPEGNIIISSVEHSAVRKTAEKYDSKTVKVDPKGLVEIDELKKLIDDKTVLVSIIHANNEIGVVQNLSEIANILESVRQERRKKGKNLPIYLHSDGAQSGNYLDLHVSRLGVDLFTLNGGKMYGPKQSGILYVRGGVRIKPQIDGGGQELGLRSGTENVANIVGFCVALEQAQAMRKEEGLRLAHLRDELIKKMQTQFDWFEVNGSIKHRLPNNLNFSVPNIDGERLVMMLDEDGIQCATGAACSALSDESSHVIKALGHSEEVAAGSIRLSFGRGTTEEELDKFLNRFKEIAQANK